MYSCIYMGHQAHVFTRILCRESHLPFRLQVTGCHMTCCWEPSHSANRRGNLASQGMVIEPRGTCYTSIKCINIFLPNIYIYFSNERRNHLSRDTYLSDFMLSVISMLLSLFGSHVFAFLLFKNVKL